MLWFRWRLVSPHLLDDVGQPALEESAVLVEQRALAAGARQLAEAHLARGGVELDQHAQHGGVGDGEGPLERAHQPVLAKLGLRVLELGADESGVLPPSRQVVRVRVRVGVRVGLG